jgi:hypothetical protein
MRKVCFWGMLCLFLMASGCASVRVTKTAKGYFPPTDADEVEILMTLPSRSYTEIAVVTTQKWSTKKTAKMHNSLRAKCAPLGADAVILGSSGIDSRGYFWASGVAIHYKEKKYDLLVGSSTEQVTNTAGTAGPRTNTQQKSTIVSTIVVKKIIWGSDRPAVLIGNQIIHEGGSVSGARVVKINQDSVEFEMNGTTWRQGVSR